MTRVVGLEGLLILVSQWERANPEGTASWLYFHYVPGSGLAEPLAMEMVRGLAFPLYVSGDGSRVLYSFEQQEVFEITAEGERRVLYSFEIPKVSRQD